MKLSKSLLSQQIQLEIEMKSLGAARFEANQKRMLDKGTAHNTSAYKSIIAEYVVTLSQVFETLRSYENSRKGSAAGFLDILNKIDSKRLAYISLSSVVDLSVSKDKTLTSVCAMLGNKVVDEINFGDLEEHAPKYFKTIVENLRRRNSVSYSHQRNAMTAAARNSGLELYKPSKDSIIQMGAVILEQVRTLKDDEGGDLFEIEMREDNGKVVASLYPSPVLDSTISEINDRLRFSKPSYAPCLIKPRRYSDFHDGGFHVLTVAATMSLVKAKRRHQNFFKDGKADVCLDAINGLQEVGYKVSLEVLDTLCNILELKIPLAVPQFDPLTVPTAPIPKGLEELKGKELTEKMTKAEQLEFFKWKEDAESIRQADKARVQELVKLGEIAKAALKYSKYDEFFFVHSMDYRQRVNVRSSFLTTQGNDVQKGILRASKGKAIGYKGAFWFLVQGAGVWNCKIDGVSLDKMPFKTRAKYVFTPEFRQMVKNICTNPLECADWVNADKPFQFLNWAFEYNDLIRLVEEGGDYRGFVSHVPVAMDGSCSGTQHYAAALRDRETAKVVNLLKTDKPNDIYQNAIAVFKDCILRELEACKPDDLERKADLTEWLNHLDRNLSKIPVMTLVYAATVMTTREAIYGYLADIQDKADRKARAMFKTPKAAHNFKSIPRAVKVATPLLWEAVNQVQAAASKGMAYIKKGVREISKRNKAFTITAPTGFVMTQEIFETKSKQVYTRLMGTTRLRINSETDKININESVSSCTPNVIHLMDSSHLIMTVANCFKSGIEFMLVIHDSFSCLAADVSKMRRILKRTLVEMYSNYCPFNAVRNACLEATDYEVDIGEIDKGDLCLEEIIQARYAFS